MTPTINEIRQALTEKRFETARRLCNVALENGSTDRNGVLNLLHDSYRHLGDLPAARAALEQVKPGSDQERLEMQLKLGEDYCQLSGTTTSRLDYEKAGMTGDEYEVKMQGIASEYFGKALALAKTAEQRRAAAESLSRAGRKDEATKLQADLPKVEEPATAPARRAAGTGSLVGTLRFADGKPVADATITLGLEMEVKGADPSRYVEAEMHYGARIGKQETMTGRTDARGGFQARQRPGGEACIPGRHAG